MTDSAWLETAKDDIAQWAMVMTKDADDNPIDWRWVRSLDLFGGLGHAAGDNPAPQAIHDALKADYAVRDRLEPIIAQCNTAFMTDFDRIIASYRLPRALAYVNRRLNGAGPSVSKAMRVGWIWLVPISPVQRHRVGASPCLAMTRQVLVPPRISPNRIGVMPTCRDVTWTW